MVYIEKQKSHFTYIRNKIIRCANKKEFFKIRLIIHASVTTAEKYLKERSFVK